MTILQATILGIIQGITEFLPVSSSGHLIVVPYLLNWQIQNLSFDIFVHFGTALAVLTFFYKDWVRMLKSLTSDVLSRKSTISRYDQYSKLLLTIIGVSIPVGIVGIMLKDNVEFVFRDPVYVAIMLILVSGVMLLADIRAKKIKTSPTQSRISDKILKLPFMDALIISLSQIIALVPGTSRSGITISTGVFRGLNRADAAKFSFLLATPIIIGAVFVSFEDLVVLDGQEVFQYMVGLIMSFVSGLLAIKLLMRFLAEHSLRMFVIYRIILAIFIVAFLGLN